jgi:hypothetical protein
LAVLAQLLGQIGVFLTLVASVAAAVCDCFVFDAKAMTVT